MKRIIYFLAISIILSGLFSCQPVYKAQKQMDKYNYAKAIDMLKKAEKKDQTHDAALPLLAECYRMQHDVLNARAAYAEVVALPDAKPDAFFYYAQALQATGNYVKAREMFQAYSEKNPADPRGKMYVAHCDSVLGPWKGLNPVFEIKQVNNVNTDQSDFGPAFCNGDLVFASDFNNNPGEGKKYGWTGRGYLNIMKSSPNQPGNFWDAMGPVSAFDKKFNQAYHDGPATFSADGNTIYFTRSFFGKAKREGNYRTNQLKIYYAQKSNGKWGDVKPFFLNSEDYSVGHPALAADGKTLYFTSDMPGGQGGTDIWMCKLEGDKWGPAINLGTTVNTSETEMFPSLTPDGTLYFASNGLPGYGSLDIFSTKNIDGKWTTPKNLQPPINGSFDDFAIAFAEGGKNGFFSSNRPGGVGSDDIYAFRQLEPAIAEPSAIAGLVKDKTTMQPLQGATVFVYDPATGNVKVLKTNAGGEFKTVITKPGDYAVKAMKANYIADCSPLTVETLNPGNTQSVPRDLLLDKLVVNKTFHIDNIYYDFDKFNIRKDAVPQLDKLVSIMKENPITVELSAHTDSRGSFAYNNKLSQNRAEAAASYIVKAGIDRSRITAKGYGEYQLVNKCADGVQCTAAEHQANRRTEFKVTGASTPQANPDQFDAGMYTEGQVLNIKMLPAGFFGQCK